MSSQSNLDLSGQIIGGGRYEVIRCIGAGGMGSVWLAIQKSIGAEVVLKIPLPSMLEDEGFRARFQLEMDSLAKLSNKHPAIVNVIDVGEHEGVPFVAMQYLAGGSLEDRMQRLRKAYLAGSDPRKVFRWLSEMAEALDFVHARKFIHRDVKPANILFDDAGRPYLADFGIAKITSEATASRPAITHADQVVGTLEYSAYELLLGEKLDGKVDQYALAVTLYEVLAGKRPFKGNNPSRISMLQKANQPERIESLCVGLPEQAADAIHRALSPQPSQRFASCVRFADAYLEAFTKTAPSEVQSQPNQRQPSQPLVQQTHARPVPSQPKQPRPLQTQPVPTTASRSGGLRPVAGPPTTAPYQADSKRRSSVFRPSKRETATEAISAPTTDTDSAPTEPLSDKHRAAASEPLAVVGPAVRQPQQGGSVRVPAWHSRSLTCPWCWNQFRPHEILWIAEHPDLHGDFKLPNEQKRFLPDLFTADCEGIDARGSRCHRTACPSCHLLVPREFIDFQPIFVSVVGIPTSGKSCLITSMAWQLRKTLPNNFQLTFTDADPELNANLCAHEDVLFLQDSGKLTRLPKTMVEGDGYKHTTIDGKQVSLAQPMIFSLRPMPTHPNFHSAQGISYTLCMYDQPGEQFLPGNANHSTRHLACADALIFVFDPSQHPKFRAAIGRSTDPQFHSGFYGGNTVRQELSLIEVANRIKKFGQSSSHQKCDKPLIFVVNKYDAWAAHFNGKRLRDPWGKSKRRDPSLPDSLDLSYIKSFSKKMRQVLLAHCPEVVSTTEDLFSDVTYVPTSAFGRPIEQDAQTGVDGVRTKDLNPMWAEVPLLTLLSNIRRGLIRKV